MNEQVQAMLLQVAEKLGTTAEHLWGVLLTQVRIKGITEIFFIILLPFLVWAWFKCLGIFQKKSAERDMSDGYEFLSALGLIFSAIVVFFFICGAVFDSPNTVACFINPEYVALKDLLGMLKTVK